MHIVMYHNEPQAINMCPGYLSETVGLIDA